MLKCLILACCEVVARQPDGIKHSSKFVDINELLVSLNLK